MDIRTFFGHPQNIKRKNKAKIPNPKLTKITISKTDSVSSIPNTSPPLTQNTKNNVPYMELAKVFSEIEKISGRLKSIQLMADFLKSVLLSHPHDLLPIIYLTVNKIAPPYENLELGIGDGILLKVIETVTGKKVAKIKELIHKSGDLANVAEKLKSQQTLMFDPPPLTCASVFNSFKKVSSAQGTKSRNTKIGIIRALLSASKSPETRFIIRSLQGNLRIGFSEGSILSALAQVFSSDKLDSETILKQVYSEVPSWDLVVPNLVENGIDNLEGNCSLRPGIPIKVMLAKAAKGIDEITDRFNSHSFTLEYKYDGERIQIHCSEAGQINFFSRNAETLTEKYPDIKAFFSRYLETLRPDKTVTSFILDSEVVAFDRVNKKILPFQTLMTRKRKKVKEGEIEVEVCLFCFDLIFFNGESLLKKPLSFRRKVLHENFTQVEGRFVFAQHRDIPSLDTEAISEFLDKAIASYCEGLMAKSLDLNASYEPSKRSLFWLKLKKDYLGSVGDSLDLVPIGAYYGKGKRKGVLGAFLLACYDDANDEYQAICKVGTGFSEEDLKRQADFFSEENRLEKAADYYRLPDQSNDHPDVWLKPQVVWEIRCADLSLSPKYSSAIGLVDNDKGVALRFPRFLRLREDKKAEEATTAMQVADMYKAQFGK